MKRVILCLTVVVLAAVLLAACATLAPTAVVEEKVVVEKLVIGSLYITSTATPWSAANKSGLRNVLNEYALELGARLVEKGDSFQVITQDGQVVVEALAWTVTNDYSSTAALGAAGSMVEKGAKLVFVTAEDWCQDLDDNFAPEHPDVGFACIRGPVAENMVSMYPKSWAGFCAACAALATVVDEPVIGLGGAYEYNPQVASNHGACAACFADAWRALGKSDEPEFASVYINSWGDGPSEHEAALALADAGVRAIAVHQDSTEYAEALAEEADWANSNWVWVIGYDRDWAQFTEPNKHILTSVVIDWSGVYRRAFRMVLDGNFEGFRWNPGFEGGAITLAPFSPAAPSGAAETAAEYQEKLRSGWRPCGDDETMWSLDHWEKCFEE